MSNTPQHPPPGWYPDPTGRPVQRYWDGRQWVGGEQPIVPQPAPVRRREPLWQRWWVLAPAVLLGVFVVAGVLGSLGGERADDAEVTTTDDAGDGSTPAQVAPEPGPETEPRAEKVLRVSVTDDTSAWEPGSSGLPNIEVWIRGTGSWFPDTSFGSDVLEDAGPFPVGEPTEFFIYPEGRDGPELAAQVVVDEDVTAGSVRDMITITVDDTAVTVAGTPIPGFEMEFAR